MAWSRLVGLTAAIVVIRAAPAQADQQFSWLNYCTVGSLQFCASVELTLAPNAAGSTDILVRMRNLQGTLGTTPWRMGATGFHDLKRNGQQPSLLWFGVPQATLTGSAGFHVDVDPDLCYFYVVPNGPCPAPSWGLSEWFEYQPDGTDRALFYWTSESLGPYQGSLVGCDAPDLAFGWGSFQTCGDGWVGMAFTLPGSWVFDDASSMSWGGFSDQGTTYCIPGTNCFQSQVTPEPVSVVLLGSGLLGVGAFGRRRRRADDA